MTHTTRVGLVLGVASLTMLAGCSPKPPPPQCSDATVSFVTPADGASVTGAFDVSIQAKLNDGTAFDFDEATLTIDDGSPIAGVVSGATATFSQVSAPAGQHTLKASVTKGSCGPNASEPSNKITVASETVTVLAGCTAKVTGVTFPQDTNGDGKLNLTELPSGTNVHVNVVATCATGVQVRIKSGTDIVGQLTDIGSGTATVDVPASADGTINLFAELVKDGAAVNTTTSNPEALGSITLQRTPPVCTNNTKLLNGPNDDATSGTTGFQLNATGTIGASTTAASFSIPGQTTQNVSPTLGTVSAQFTLPASGDTTYAVSLVCTDAAGNTTTDTKMVRIDFVPPTVVITSPVALDGGPALATQSPTNIVVATNAEDGTNACATRISGATRSSAGCQQVANGAVTLPVSFSGDGLYGIEVQATDLVGNTSIATASLLVQLSGCGLGFTRPDSCPGLITSSQVSSGNYGFRTQSKTTCSGQPVALTVRPKLADGGVGALSAVGNGTVEASGAANIVGAVSSGSFLYSASVTNVGVDAGFTSADCDVTVDLEGPSITSPTSAAGQTTTINVTQDTAPSIAGAQRLLQFSARVPTGGRVDLCTTQAVDPESGTPRATTTECGTNYYLLHASVTSPSNGFTFPEGTYHLKIVVVGGGMTVSSPDVSLFVDVTRPCILGASRRLPQDANSDSKLNASELGSAAPQLEFALDPTCKDTGPSTLASNPIVIRNLVNGAPAGSFSLPTDITFAGSTVTANLTQGVSNEQDYSFFVQITDSAGNSNTYSGGTDPSMFNVRIDKVAPSCSITSPSASQTLLGSAQVPSGMLAVTAETVADVGTDGIAVTLTGSGSPQSSTLTPLAPAYQASTSFPVTGTHEWTIAARCTDIAGNSTAATSRVVTVDLDPPTCTLTSPTAAAPYGSNQISTSMTVVGAEGRSVSCTSDGSPLSPSFLVSSGVATQTLTYNNGTHTVACSVSDTAGNPCVSSVSNVVVNSTACPLTLTNAVVNVAGSWFNRTNTTVGSGTSGTAVVSANTPTCGAGKVVTLIRTAPTAGTAVTQQTDASGNVQFTNVALTHGETWSVTIDNGAGVTNSQSFQVALVAPSAAAVTIDSVAAPGGALYFVAATGNHNVELGTAGYFADLNGAAAGAQFDLQVTGVTGARVFGNDGTIEVLFKGTVIVSQGVTTDPQTITFAATTLPHNDSGSLEVRVLDAAGNQTAVTSNTATIDVIAPGAPSVTQTVKNTREATVNLQWSPTYDDGADGTSGANGGYDVRWTTMSVPTIVTGFPDAGFFDSHVRQAQIVAWSASSISYDLPLPPLNTYFVSVRAFDEVGNFSTYTPPSALPNMWTQVLLQAPVASSSFGQSVLTAKLNNDALDDIVVSAPTKTGGGAVYVYYGSASFTDQATCGAGCQELDPSDTTAGQFGSDIASGGNIGDVASEHMNDLVIGQYWTTAPLSGRAVIFFGSSGATLSTATSIEIRGDASNRIGYSVRIIKDIDGDALDELAIAAPFFNGNRGRVYVFKGRTQAAWASARTATDPISLVPYIPVTSANYVIDGPSTLLVSPAGNAFGQNRGGLISVGDINADSIPDVAIPMSRPSINRYRIYSGAAIAASSLASPLDGGLPILELSLATVASNAVTDGLGASSVSTDISGATAADLITAFPAAAGAGQVLIYGDPVAAASQPSPTATILGPLTFGTQVSVGQINSSDTRQDLVIGQASGTANVCWVVYQQAGVRPWDGTGISSQIGTSSEFWVSKFNGPSIVGGNSSLGKSNAIGDIDGVNGNDIVLGDDAAGQVRIWR